jgi:hypothetical protein
LEANKDAHELAGLGLGSETKGGDMGASDPGLERFKLECTVNATAEYWELSVGDKDGEAGLEFAAEINFKLFTESG